jgi:PAS domain S-box-containing protein
MKAKEKSGLQNSMTKNQLSAIKNHVQFDISDVMEVFPFYVMLVDEHHHILQANSAVRELLQMEPNEVLGKYCPEVIHGLNEPWYACPLEEAVEKGQAVELEAFDDKSRRWIRSAIYPIKKPTQDGGKVFFHMVTDITERKEAEAQLRNSQEQLRALSRHLESVKEEERTKLAFEIHDELGQLLTGLKIDLSWIAKRIAKGEKSLAEKIKTMNELIDKSVETVKKISSELRPGVLDHLGIAAAIEWQAQELEKHTDINFKFKSTPEEIVLDRDRSTAIFRICQEALTNIIRHANATKVKITLKKEPGRIILIVSDNGKGIDEEQIYNPKAFGIIGMRERARSWEGEVKINSMPGKGTTVEVNIPITSSENFDVENINR